MRTLAIILLTLLALALVALGLVYAGAFSVAASSGHSRLTGWLLHTAMHQSVSMRARGIEPPLGLEEPELAARGAANYEAHCAICHLSPLRPDSPLAEGLTPQPPQLAAAEGHWGPAELFWITKHGIKMTGMPAWGATFTDAEIWELVAFLKAFPQISDDDYEQLQQGERLELEEPQRHSDVTH